MFAFEKRRTDEEAAGAERQLPGQRDQLAGGTGHVPGGNRHSWRAGGIHVPVVPGRGEVDGSHQRHRQLERRQHRQPQHLLCGDQQGRGSDQPGGHADGERPQHGLHLQRQPSEDRRRKRQLAHQIQEQRHVEIYQSWQVGRQAGRVLRGRRQRGRQRQLGREQRLRQGGQRRLHHNPEKYSGDS